MSWDIKELYPANWDAIKASIKKRDRFTCRECNKKYPPHSLFLHVHHIVPLSKGGSSKGSNLITLCKNCHKKKHPHMQVIGGKKRAKFKGKFCY